MQYIGELQFKGGWNTMLLKIYLVVFLFFYTVVNANDYKEMDDISLDSLFSMSVAEFKIRYHKKYGLNWYSDDHGAVASNVKLLGQIAQFASFGFSKKKVVSVSVDIKKLENETSYEKMAKRNAEILKTLKAKYGKPKMELLKDRTVRMTWNVSDKLYVLYEVRILRDSHLNSSFSLQYCRNKSYASHWSQSIEMTDDALNALLSSVYLTMENNRPDAKETQAVLLKLKNFKPENINDNNRAQVYYSDGFLLIDWFQLLYSNMFFLSVSKKMKTKPAQPAYSQYFVRDSKLLSVKNFSSSFGSEAVMYSSQFTYHEGVVKVINQKTMNGKETYWLDYDERGYLSRVISVQGDQITNIIYFYAENNYSKYIAVDYDYLAGRVESFWIQDGQHRVFKDKPHYYLHNGSDYSPDYTPMSKNFKKFNDEVFDYLLPNSKDETFKPSVPVDSSFLKNELKVFKELLESDKEKHRYVQQNKKNILKSDDPFDALSKEQVILVGREQGAGIPFIINKVDKKGKTAVQLKYNNKLFTVFKNQTVLKLKLTEISDEGATFVHVDNGKNFVMETGVAFQPEKAFIFNYQGANHLLQSGENFMGSQLLVDKDQTGFLHGETLVRSKSLVFELPSYNENEGGHTLKNCKCFDDPVNKPFFALSPRMINLAKNSEINEEYLSKFCFFELYEERKVFGRMTPVNLGIFYRSGNQIKQISKGSDSCDVKLSLKNDKLLVDDKLPEKKVSDRIDYYLVKLDDGRRFSIRYFPNNPWTLSRYIKNLETYLDRDHYTFASHIRKTREGSKFPFEYKVDPVKNTLKIDGTVFDLVFLPDLIYIFPRYKMGNHMNLHFGGSSFPRQ